MLNINEPTTYKREIRQETEVRRQKEEDEKEEKRRCNMAEVLIQIWSRYKVENLHTKYIGQTNIVLTLPIFLSLFLKVM